MIKIQVIPTGTILYRFVNRFPTEINLELRKNKGDEHGRFNKYSNIYYCSLSMTDILQEQNAYYSKKLIQGSVITSEVIKPIYVGVPTNAFYNLCKAVNISEEKNKELNQMHITLKSINSLPTITDYNITNEFFKQFILDNNLDGIGYGSSFGIDCYINNTLYFMSDSDSFPGINNLALTESGFNKIKQQQPTIFWYQPKV